MCVGSRADAAALAGAASGLLAGAIATLVYCLHCPEMTAPFLAIWYVLGMASPTAPGALLGPRVRRAGKARRVVCGSDFSLTIQGQARPYMPRQTEV